MPPQNTNQTEQNNQASPVNVPLVNIQPVVQPPKRKWVRVLVWTIVIIVALPVIAFIILFSIGFITGIMESNTQTTSIKSSFSTDKTERGCQSSTLAKYKTEPLLMEMFNQSMEKKPEILRAVVSDDGDKILSLIKSGTDINEADDNGENALMLSVTLTCPYSFQVLLDNEADVNAVDNKGQTVVMYAMASEQSDMISKLIAKGANVEAKDKSGYTALHRAVMANNISAINLLVNNGADINVQNSTGSTPLVTAILMGKIEVIRALLELGADSLLKTNAGMTAMDYIKVANGLKNQQEIIDLLESYIK